MPGYALLIIMMMVTVLLVSLTVALPSVYVEGQREREEELIFRGTEYQRAIALFRRRFNRFPSSVDELLRTNGIRFLRRAYQDPMSRDGKWRFIHANVNGTLLDSKTLGPAMQGGAGPAAAGGNPQNAPPGSGYISAFAMAGRSAGSAAGFGSSAGQGGEVQGALVAGVASASTKESIRVLNNHTHYSEWEFIGVEGAAGLSGGAGGALGPPTQAGTSGAASPQPAFGQAGQGQTPSMSNPQPAPGQTPGIPTPLVPQ